MIAVVNQKEKHNYTDWFKVNLSSSIKEWADLNPSVIGPVTMYSNLKSNKLENAWQFSKVFPIHFKNKKFTKEYSNWALMGWASRVVHKFPMGRQEPLFYLWDNKRLNEVEARKEILIPLYEKSVRYTEAFKKLQALYKTHKNIVLIDSEGYDYMAKNMSINDVINDPEKPLSHAFILAKMLQE